MVLEITRRQKVPLPPPFDRWLLSQIYWWFRDWTKLQKVLRWKRNAQTENQGSANGNGTARRQRALGARRVEKKFQRNIARSLPFHWTPQETGRMLLKMQNDVNASLRGCKMRRHPGHLAHLRKFRRTEAQYMECNNLLARGVSCGRLASFAAPLL